MLPFILATVCFAPTTTPRARAPAMGILDGIVGAARETFREVTVQHVLCGSQLEANEVYDAVLEEGATSTVVGRYAAARNC